MGVSAAIHGDELNGIPAMHRLFEGLDVQRLKGTVVAVMVANPVAFRRRQRRLDEGIDLNHVFPGKRRGTLGEVLAYRIRKQFLQRIDVLLDLHTASRGRVNSLYVRADMSDVRTARLAYLQRPEIIVHNPPSDGTLRGAAASAGIPAITVEIGNPSSFQDALTKRTTSGLRAVMANMGMISRRPPALGEEPIVCTRSRWTYTEAGGLLRVVPPLRARVDKGDTLATLTDIFGRPHSEVSAPFAGVVVGHAVDPVATTGTRVVHLGEVVDDDGSGLVSREQALASEVPWTS